MGRFRVDEERPELGVGVVGRDREVHRLGGSGNSCGLRVCGKRTSLDLTTEMVTVLGADVRSSEFVAGYLRATHMCEQRGARTCANEGATHMCHTHVPHTRANKEGHPRANKGGFADTYLKMLIVSSPRLGSNLSRMPWASLGSSEGKIGGVVRVLQSVEDEEVGVSSV